MADNEGYWGDEEGGGESSVEDFTGEEVTGSQSNTINNGLSQQFFSSLPKRWKRKDPPEIIDVPVYSLLADTNASIRRKVPSVYYTSRWLNQVFLSQTPADQLNLQDDSHVIPRGGSTPPVTRQYNPNGELHMSFSRNHVRVEDAISFSTYPRVLIESEVPHRIVHSNAAYARKYGISQRKTGGFSAPHVRTIRDMEVAISSLFDATDKLVMYPVWGSDREIGGHLQLVTHFLIEVSDGSKQDSTSKPRRTKHHCWKKTVTQTVA